MKFPERNAEIVRRRYAGAYPHQISEALGVSKNVVIGVLHRAGVVFHDNKAAQKIKPTASGFARWEVRRARYGPLGHR